MLKINNPLKAFLLTLLLFLFGISTGLLATHNRAGEISFEQIGPLTIRATLTTYTKTSSVAADRDSIEIFWGDGSSEITVRSNGWGDPQPNDVKINYYIAVHTYPARATYTISMYDPNRVGGILNVNYPDSESVPFYLSTTFTFLNTQFQGENNSAVLLQAPIDFGCVGEVFIHNPNAYDVDGDSLVYTLIIPLQGNASIVPDYVFPDQIGSGSNNTISINNLSGDLVWDAPQVAGEYNVAILIEEYRQGILINSMIRDMQIFILDACENQPPELSLIDERCVFAGEKVTVEIVVDDPNQNQKVRIEASGAPFISTVNLASLEGGFEYNTPAFISTFEWTTSCEDISDQYYQIIFKAMDNGISDTSGLATLKSLKIKVLGPPPEELESIVQEDHHLLEWSYPYACAFAKEDFFSGFSIWRSESSISIPNDTCVNGLNASGYEKIEFQVNENDGIHYQFRDFEIEQGKTYCYRVLPEFAKRSFDGFPYNQVSGVAGNETCLSIPSALPYLTKNSVISTSNTNGEIEVNWSMNQLKFLDTLLYPGPYILQLLRTEDGVFFDPLAGASYNLNDINASIDTSFIDEGLNTTNNAYTYILDLKQSEGEQQFIGSSLPASSVFLEALPSDQTVSLNYSTDVPWYNYNYKIYRKEDGSNFFDLIGETEGFDYVDQNLENGKNYCYKILSEGYHLFDQLDTILNYSQELCVHPKDNTPPCPPSLKVLNPCDTLGENPINELLMNELSWDFTEPCFKAEDLAGFRIYYSLNPGDSLLQIEEFSVNDIKSFSHSGDFGLRGCYAITAIDSSQNESLLSNVVCVENCPLYELPNVFTPNDDGDNDLFTPRINRHIFSIDMKVYNQWGQLVFKTTDPSIGWDGTNLNGRSLAEGVYHYVCIPYSDLDSMQADVLSGYIHLIRGR